MASASKNCDWRLTRSINDRHLIYEHVRKRLRNLYPDSTESDIERQAASIELNNWQRGKSWEDYMREIARALSQATVRVEQSHKHSSPSTAHDPAHQVQHLAPLPCIPHRPGLFQQHHGRVQQSQNTAILQQRPQLAANGHMKPGHPDTQTQPFPGHVALAHGQIQIQEQLQRHHLVQQQTTQLLSAQYCEQRRLLQQIGQVAPAELLMHLDQMLLRQHREQLQTFFHAPLQTNGNMAEKQQTGQLPHSGAKKAIPVARAKNGPIAKRGAKSRTRGGSSAAARGSRRGKSKAQASRNKRKPRNEQVDVNLEEQRSPEGKNSALTCAAANLGEQPAASVPDAISDELWMKLCDFKKMHGGRLQELFPIMETILHGRPPSRKVQFWKAFSECQQLMDMERDSTPPNELNETSLRRAENFINVCIQAANKFGNQDPQVSGQRQPPQHAQGSPKHPPNDANAQTTQATVEQRSDQNPEGEELVDGQAARFTNLAESAKKAQIDSPVNALGLPEESMTPREGRKRGRDIENVRRFEAMSGMGTHVENPEKKLRTEAQNFTQAS